MNKIKAIISDSDGTLVNTIYLIRHGQYEAVAAYLMKLGIPLHDIPTYEVYESFINKSVGGTTRETLEKTLQLLFRETHEHHLNKMDFDEIDKSLHPIQDRIAILYVHPFHGLTELFSWLGGNNISIGIFTSGDRRMILRNYGVSLPALGYTDLYKSDEISVTERLDSFITRTKAVYGVNNFEIVTCEDVTKTKPDPEGIFRLMDKLSVQSDEVLVIGDHPVDIQAARKAGLHAIGISHGFGTAAELKDAGALKVIENLSMIPEIIEMHNNKSNILF